MVHVHISDGLRTIPEVPPISTAKVENECSTNSSILPEVTTLEKADSNTLVKPEPKQPDRLLSKEENKRRNKERFSAGGNFESMKELTAAEPNDPLSSIDPLWSLKKNHS